MCSILFPRHEGSVGGEPCPHMAEFIWGLIAWKIMPSYVFTKGECQLVARQCGVCPSHLNLLVDLHCLPSTLTPPSDPCGPLLLMPAVFFFPPLSLCIEPSPVSPIIISFPEFVMNIQLSRKMYYQMQNCPWPSKSVEFCVVLKSKINFNYDLIPHIYSGKRISNLRIKNRLFLWNVA